MSDQIVTVKDVYACGWCAMGARRVLRQYGLDYRKFFKEGLPVEQFEQIDDYFAQTIAKEVRHGR